MLFIALYIFLNTSSLFVFLPPIYACASLVIQAVESACSARDRGSIPGSERYPGEGNGNPLQYPYLGNPMDTGAWQATALGDATVRHDLATKAPYRIF